MVHHDTNRKVNMFTIAILNQKGGSGKSTVAECLAVAAYLDGQASAILDLDPQGTAYSWGKRREDANPPVISVTLANLNDEWERLKEAGADIVFIDTPARLDNWAREAAEISDIVLIPAKPTIKDIERVEASIKLACIPEPRPTFVVLNQVRQQGDRNAQAEKVIKEKRYPVCPARFGFRVAFEDSDTLGQTPQETEPKGKAAGEIQLVYQYTKKLLNQLTNKKVNRDDKKKGSGRRAA